MPSDFFYRYIGCFRKKLLKNTATYATIKEVIEMELKIAVCDDEAVVRSALINALETLDIVFKAKEYSSGSELVMSDEEYDLIFLDIEMDGINGMETAEQLRKKGCKSNIVFLTSHTEFMQAAFRVRAFRFLEKPVDKKMLEEAVMETCAELMQDKKIVVKSGGEVVTLNCEDIISLEAFGDGTYIYTKDDVICAQAQLKHLLAELESSGFIQVHKSYAVAFRHIRALNKSSVSMDFVKDEIPVSRRKYSQLKTSYFEFIRSNAKYV